MSYRRLEERREDYAPWSSVNGTGRHVNFPQAPVRHWYFIEAHQIISTLSNAATAARSGWAPQGAEPRNDYYGEQPSPGPGRGRRAGLVRQFGPTGLCRSAFTSAAHRTMDTLAAYLRGHVTTDSAAWGQALPVPCADDPGTGEGADVSALLKSFWVSAYGAHGPFSLHKAQMVAMRRRVSSWWVRLRQLSAMMRSTLLYCRLFDLCTEEGRKRLKHPVNSSVR